MTTHTLHPRYDVVIAGARVAGASLAMLLARRGARVLVVDPLPRGRDTLSTHALMRGAVLQLHRWGVLDAVRRAGTPPVISTVFDYDDETVSVPIEPRDGVDALYAPRRTVLDVILSDAAEQAGASVVRAHSLVDVVRDESGRVRGAVIEGRDRVRRTVLADHVVGADGVRSRVARLVAAPVEQVAGHTTASIYGYWAGLESNAYRWYFRPGLGVGTIPTNGGSSCVFVSVAPSVFAARGVQAPGIERLFHDTVRAADPALADRLRDQPPVPLRAFAGMKGFLRRPTGPGWALVGDASSFKDPLTAHGITDALRDAELLADALASSGPTGLERYAEARDAVAREIHAVTDRIASLAWTTEEVKRLHLDLSRAMRVGLNVVRAMDGPARIMERAASG